MGSPILGNYHMQVEYASLVGVLVEKCLKTSQLRLHWVCSEILQHSDTPGMSRSSATITVPSNKA